MAWELHEITEDIGVMLQKNGIQEENMKCYYCNKGCSEPGHYLMVNPVDDKYADVDFMCNTCFRREESKGFIRQ